MLGPGVAFRDVHMAAAREGVVGLKELGLMRGDPDEAVASGAYAFFFPCGTGHMIGLDVHDMEDYGEIHVGYEGSERSSLFGLKSLRLAKRLKAGMTFTVEPGLYFIPELYAMWEAEGRFAGLHRLRRREAMARLRRHAERGGLARHRGRREDARAGIRQVDRRDRALARLDRAASERILNILKY